MELSASQTTLLSMGRMRRHTTCTYLHEAMERNRKAGIKLNDEKCVIKTKEYNFFGMLYTPDGVKPNPDKIRAIEGMETPKDKKELHTFLGMATYMSSFIPKLADHTQKRIQDFF